MSRLIPVSIALAVCGLTACGGGDSSTQSAPSPSKSASVAAPSKAPAAHAAAQATARSVCTDSAAAQKAFDAFMTDGPSSETAAKLNPFTAKFDAYKTSFLADPKGAAAARVVDLLRAQAQGWEVLFGQGETAYQEPKANGHNVDTLGEEIKKAWPAAMRALGFTDATAPHAPVVFAEGHC